MARQEEGYSACQLTGQCRTASLPRGKRGFRQHRHQLRADIQDLFPRYSNKNLIVYNNDNSDNKNNNNNNNNGNYGGGKRPNGNNSNGNYNRNNNNNNNGNYGGGNRPNRDLGGNSGNGVTSRKQTSTATKVAPNTGRATLSTTPTQTMPAQRATTTKSSSNGNSGSVDVSGGRR